MTRLETLNLLIDISEAVQHFERKIQTDTWSNQFGAGLEWEHINHKNTNDIHTYKRCIDRLNERFNKYKNTL